MKQSWRGLAAAWGALVVVTLACGPVGCRTVPITGRTQILLGSDRDEIARGERAYRALLQEYPPSESEDINQIVQQVGHRIAVAAEVPHYNWEFQVVATDIMNACCLSGGKVIIHEGILPVCRTEGGLAAILAHEVAHALARHLGERRAQAQFSNLGRVFVDEYAKSRGARSQLTLGLGYRAMAEYGVRLPHSRSQEKEADEIGLMLMSRAGYDPIEAVEFWGRMLSHEDGARKPEFTATHPSSQTRIGDLLELMPKARRVYQAAPVQFGRGKLLPDRLSTPVSRQGNEIVTAGRHYNAGVQLLETGQYRASITEFSKAITLNPMDHEAQFNRGNAHFQLGEFDRAMADYMAVLKLVPDYQPAQKNLQLALDQVKGASS